MTNTYLEIAVKWCDFQLGTVVHLCPVAPFSRQEACSTSNTDGYYPSIPTELGVQTIHNWLQLHHEDLPQKLSKFFYCGTNQHNNE